MTLRWGLLSTARINDKLIDAGGGRFTTVASRDQGKADRYARERGLARAHGSYEALLADPDVDAVYISLPNGMHVDWSTRALEAGKHVLCEKPLTRRPEEAEAVFALAQERGLVLSEAFMWRHHPQALEARRLIETGAIGELRLLSASFAFLLSDPSDVRLQQGLDGGALMDIGCYCVSGCRTLAGAEPVSVSAEQVLGGDGVDVAMAAVLRFPGDVLATIDCSFASSARMGLEAVGDQGSLHLADPWHGNAAAIELRTEGGVEVIDFETAGSYTLELDDFEAAVRGDRQPLLGADDAIGQARTIAALYEAAEQRTD